MSYEKESKELLYFNNIFGKYEGIVDINSIDDCFLIPSRWYSGNRLINTFISKVPSNYSNNINIRKVDPKECSINEYNI